MSDKLDPLKPLHEASFIEGQKAVAKDVTARRLEEQLKNLGKAGLVAAETLNLADQLAANGDPHKQELAKFIKSKVIGEVFEREDGRQQAEEGGEAIEARPFSNSNDSPRSVTSSSGSTRALPDASSSEPPKPRRGRPPGSKNRAKSE